MRSSTPPTRPPTGRSVSEQTPSTSSRYARAMPVAMLLMLAIAGLLLWRLTAGDDDGDRPAAHETDLARPSDGPSTSAAMTACQTQIAGAEAIVRSSRTGIEHWKEHLQAGVDTVAGRLNFDEASQIWRQTRDAGHEDVRRYLETMAAFPKIRGNCGDGNVSRGCKDRNWLLGRTMTEAARVMRDWQTTQEAMAGKPAGTFAGSHAVNLRRMATHAAGDRLDSYDAAYAELQDAPACSL